jgi:hypothetical protein
MTGRGTHGLVLATVPTLVSLWLILRAPDAIGIEMPLGALVAPTTVADAP